MIIFPKNWHAIGQPIPIGEIEDSIIDALMETGCKSIALSGGIDSGLLLYFMVHLYGDDINAFTTGASSQHPDVKYAKLLTSKFGISRHYVFIPKSPLVDKLGDYPGDSIVRFLYESASTVTSEIIAGDGIDEFMCGYYAHQESPGEDTYYHLLKKLQKEQLDPLDRNSGDMRVHLPYLSEKVVHLLSQVPIKEKVDLKSRKKLMLQMARDRLPNEIIIRRKYGFCDAMKIK